MRLSLLSAAAFTALAGSALAQPAPAPLPPDYPPVTGSLDPASPGAPAPRFESDGNANMPRAMNAPASPNYTQGSGQQTGGPARELIPR